MTFPGAPYPGLVIRYAYLWSREADIGREEAHKDRPCAIVVTVLKSNNDVDVIALPITHTAPDNPMDAIEIPAVTKARLGLDEARSWVVIAESNVFVWPGPDLRPIGDDEASVTYGSLPPRFFAAVRDRFFERYLRDKKVPVRRTE